MYYDNTNNVVLFKTSKTNVKKSNILPKVYKRAK